MSWKDRAEAQKGGSHRVIQGEADADETDQEERSPDLG